MIYAMLWRVGVVSYRALLFVSTLVSACMCVFVCVCVCVFALALVSVAYHVM